MPALDLSSVSSEADFDAVPDAETVEWAFVVYKKLDGETVMHHDIHHPIEPMREAHPDEVHGAAANVMMDIAAMRTAVMGANATVNGMMQITAQMQEQQQNQMIQQQLAKGMRR